MVADLDCSKVRDGEVLLDASKVREGLADLDPDLVPQHCACSEGMHAEDDTTFP